MLDLESIFDDDRKPVESTKKGVAAVQATILQKDDVAREYRESCAQCGKFVAKLSYDDVRRFGLNDLDWSDRMIARHKEWFLCVCDLKRVSRDGKTLWW